ncbi:MAG TPA: hypothetical protein VI819_02650 [Patescibacteria group bacterium]|nr:hypothetical protein [Patescibacteria group bacterium]
MPVCHVPKGNPSNAHVIIIDENGWKDGTNPGGHQDGGHGGDYLLPGPVENYKAGEKCSPPEPPKVCKLTSDWVVVSRSDWQWDSEKGDYFQTVTYKKYDQKDSSQECDSKTETVWKGYSPCDEQTAWTNWNVILDWTNDPIQNDLYRRLERYTFDAHDSSQVCLKETKTERKSKPEEPNIPESPETPNDSKDMPRSVCIQREIVSEQRVDLETGFSSIIHWFVDRINMVLYGETSVTVNQPNSLNSHSSINPVTGCEEVYGHAENTELYQLWIHSIDGSNPRPIKNQGEVIHGNEADWGMSNLIAYVAPNGYLKVTDEKGSFIDSFVGEDTKSFMASNPDWSPDGKYIAYTNSDDSLTVMPYPYEGKGTKSNIECAPLRWEADQSGINCFQKEAGWVLVKFPSLEVQPVASWISDMVPDPEGGNAVVVVNISDQMYFVPDISSVENSTLRSALPDMKAVSIEAEDVVVQDLNPDWYSPNKVVPESLDFDQVRVSAHELEADKPSEVNIIVDKDQYIGELEDNLVFVVGENQGLKEQNDLLNKQVENLEKQNELLKAEVDSLKDGNTDVALTSASLAGKSVSNQGWLVALLFGVICCMGIFIYGMFKGYVLISQPNAQPQSQNQSTKPVTDKTKP